MNPTASDAEIKAARSLGPGDALAKFEAEFAYHQAAQRREQVESERRDARDRRRRLKDEAEQDRERLQQGVMDRLRKFSAGVAVVAAADATANVSEARTSRGKRESMRPTIGDDFHTRMRHAVNEIAGHVGNGDEEGARRLLRDSERELDALRRRPLDPPKAA